METLFDFSQVDLSAAPALVILPVGNFNGEDLETLKRFETEYDKYVNLGEIVNYETAEILVDAFGEFQEANELYIGSEETAEEDGVENIAMISGVTLLTLGTRQTVLITIIPAYDEEELEQDDFE